MQKPLFNFCSFSRFYLLTFFLFTFPLLSEVSISELNRRVMDESGILDSMQVTALEDKLKTLEQNKGSQVVILIIPSTMGEPIEHFSMRVVEKWKLGRKDINDGVLITIATQDRKMRIEVGYGLEGVLPDAICKRIISEQMKPHFKEKNYYEGIDDAVNSISKLINGEPLPPPSKKTSKAKSKDYLEEVFFFCFFLVFFGAGIIEAFTSTTIGKLFGSGIFGGIGSLISMGLLGLSLSIGLFIFIVLAVIIFLISISRSRGGYSDGSGSGWSSSSSSSSWGSSSSSDSFSGGGGSFGGGGSSGDW